MFISLPFFSSLIWLGLLGNTRCPDLSGWSGLSYYLKYWIALLMKTGGYSGLWSGADIIYVNNVYDWRYAPEPSDPASRCWAGVLAECGEASLLSAWPVQRSVICFVSVNYVPPRAQLPIRGRRRTPLSSRGGLTTLDRAALVTLALTPGSGTHGSQL